MKTGSNDTILEISNVSKFYQTGRSLFSKSEKKMTALDKVSLKIKKGEIFGLVGKSGSGKSTIGRLVLDLEKPDMGTIVFGETEINSLKGQHLKMFRQKMQMICQDPYQSLNPYFSVFDTIAEPLIIHKVGEKKTRQERVQELLEDFGLVPAADFINRYPHQLSGGQRQRVAIARAMVLHPEFIVADEPTSMLDATVSIQIYSILAHLKKNVGITILFITHNIAAARLLCDRIAVLNDGIIVETGDCDAIINNPASEYTKALIQAQPSFSFEKT